VHSVYLHPVVAAFRACRRSGTPYLVSPHGSFDPWHRNQRRGRKGLAHLVWLDRMLRGAAALHFATAEEARLAADLAPQVSRVIVPAGLDLAAFRDLPAADDFRTRYLNGCPGPVVLNIGRLSEKKGHDVLVEAFSIAARDRTDARLVLVGPDDEGLQARLSELAAESGIRDRIVFTGMLRGKEKLGALAAADVWALPSATENFGVAVIEALAAGVPTIVSPAVNVAADLAAAGAGVVCERTPEAFGRELVALLDDDERRRSLSRRGREFAKRFDTPALAPRWAQVYASIAEKGGR
jgi:glycosyltransferase involved in cell wall biosynthesis